MKNLNMKYSIIVLFVLVLNNIGIRAQVNTDSLVNVAFGTVAKEDMLGAITTINVSELIKKGYGTYSLDNLQSFIAGYNGNIWGQSPLVLVDGIPRRATDVRMIEVETITIMKGASAVVLYGGNASKGVILITTKRGTIKPLSIDVRLNSGILTPKEYPNYLNAADYMTLYNEASRNDGIAERYTQDQIDKTRAGANPYRYPDVDFFSSQYLKKFFSRSDLTAEISGGNERSKYYTNVGMLYNNSIMNYGDQKNNRDFSFNVRSNVDMKLTDKLTAWADVTAIIADNYAGRGNFWGTSATLRPNWFNPLIPIDQLEPGNKALETIVANSNYIIDNKYLLGGLSTDQTNAFADMLVAGYIKTKNRTFMFNAGANADLSSILKGLSFKSSYSMDYASVFSEAYQVGYAVYEPTWSAAGGAADTIKSLRKYNNDQSSTNEFIGRTSYNQTQSFRAQFDYSGTFSGKHHLNAKVLGWWFMSQFSSDANNEGGSSYHPIRNTNLGFQATYNFKRKYYLDFSSALIHSAKLAPGRRNAFSPAVTLGWRISDESFFKDNISFVDDLKVTASYANINQDLDITGFMPNGTTPTDYYLYQGMYGNNSSLGGWYPWRDGASGGFTTISGRGENLNLTFIERNEFRFGLNGSLLKNLITFDLNYFNQKTNGLLTRGTTIFPSYFTGNGDFRPWLNFNNDLRTGFDFGLAVHSKLNKLHFSVGVNGMIFNSEALKRDEVFQDAYQYRAGKPIDAYWGYIAEGFFQTQDEINGHARQTFGGEVKPGDIKYRDVNNDGLIDTKDQVDLGRNGWAVAPFTLGLNITLKWKNFTLLALADGQFGAIGFKNSSYFWVRGSSKFSEPVLGRWTPETANTANFPRLTTTNGNNNYQNSTFWQFKNNRFNINRVQLNYDFKSEIFKKSILHNLGVYVQGDNLFVISKERQLMETNIGSAPQFRFFNFGVRASF